MLRQFEILEEIAQAAFNVSHGEYDELVLEVKVDVEEGWIEATCKQTLGGTTEQLSLFDVEDPDLMALSFALHEAMKEHTGGDMKKYTLRIDGKGAAKASFEYRNLPPKKGEAQ